MPALGAASSEAPLRICADPNNLPYSNRAEEGFENRIAALLGRELQRPVVYTWWPQRRGFLRNTLKAGRCDLVIGVPTGLDAVATTRPYYRSRYVFLYAESADYRLTSLDDSVLRELRIGVHLIGDDYMNSPPAHALSSKGIVDNVVGYSVFGDYGEPSPPRVLVDAVGSGEIDVAIVWGPIAGYFRRQQPAPLVVQPVPDDPGRSELLFSYAMAMGMRHGDDQLRQSLNKILVSQAAEIRGILEEYGVPTSDAGE